MYTHVIWDFNGTILRDMEVGIKAMNRILSERGMPPIRDLAAYREIFDFPVESYYHRLGLDRTGEDFQTVLAPLWVSYYHLYDKEAPLYDGVRPLCAALRAAGARQSVLSVSERGMMERQLRERGALSLFDEIWGTDTILAIGKEGLAAAWRAAHPTDRALLLGDTTHDCEVARAIGADCILVADGHQSAARLSACGVPVVATLNEVLPLLRKKGE